jgi:hypothetical protein
LIRLQICLFLYLKTFNKLHDFYLEMLEVLTEGMRQRIGDGLISELQIEQFIIIIIIICMLY